jgi:hypothetical protein
MCDICCNPSYSEGRGRNITASRTTQAKLSRPYPKHKIKMKGLEHSYSGRALA